SMTPTAAWQEARRQSKWMAPAHLFVKARLPPIRLGPTDRRVRSWLVLLDLFLVDGEPRLQVVRQGSRMGLGAGMQPGATGTVAPRLVDGPLEEIPSQPLPDEFRHQPKLHQFDFSVDPPVQLGKTSRDAIDRQEVNFEPGIVQEGGEFGVREFLAAGPV